MISIVTVSYNAAATIRQTIRSVLCQSYPDIEYIIIDGASIDDTVDILKSYETELTDWVSEPDQGIADAMNKGLYRAKGKYILYLNADDYLTDPLAIERVARSLDTAIVTGPIIKLEPDDSERIVYPRGFNWWMNLKTGLFHQATFCSTELLNSLGGFDTRYKLEMDYELFLRAYRRNVSIKMLNQPFSVMRSGGVSTRNDTTTLKNRLVEEKSIHLRNCPNSVMKPFYSAYWAVYPSYKLMRGKFDQYRSAPSI